MDYGNILSRSWSIVWNNKFLWLLGFLAALGSVGSSGNSGRSFSQRVENGDINPDVLVGLGAMMFGLVCLGLLLGLILYLVSLAANGGLISAAARLDDGEKVTLGEAFGAGTGALGRLIGISLLLWLPFIVLIVASVFVAIVAVGGTAAAMSAFSDVGTNPEAAFASLGIFFLCCGALCCVLVPLAIVTTVINEFAFRSAMLHDLGVTDSIRAAWQMIRTNLGDVVLLMILLFAIAFMYGLLVGVVMLPLALLLFVPLGVMAASDGSSMIAVVMLVIGGLCLGLFGAVLNSIVTAWRSTAITLAFRQLSAKPVVSYQ